MPDRRHEAWLRFVRSVVDVPSGRSKDELVTFLRMAERQHPALAPVIEAYLGLAYASDTDIQRRSSPAKRSKRQMHLFDLLREKTFFPQNLDLAHFASRVLPDLKAYRFDKMSRSDIAGRIIEYIEDNDPSVRESLEVSMRDALFALGDTPNPDTKRRSFLSTWEKIIKGTQI